MDNVIHLVPGILPIGSDDAPEVTDLKISNAWAAAAISAISDKALWGCLLFVNSDGDFCRIPIQADHVSLRGLFEIALDDLKLD